MRVPAEFEAEWIAAAREGDRRAFGDLVNHYQDGVIGLMYRMLGDPYFAEDAAQEAFLKTWRQIRGYDPQYPFRSWLYRIATNTALDFARRDASRRTKAAPQVDPGELASPDGSPEAALDSSERSEQVRRAILALPEASRAALVLREYEGLSYKEISAALGVPVGTVMSRLNYARSQLRKELSNILEGA